LSSNPELKSLQAFKSEELKTEFEKLNKM